MELDDETWRAIAQRSAGADGSFFYAVVTTGVFCRPSCPARRPRRENVRLFPSAVDAGRAGFRPCKRCRPDSRSIEHERIDAVARACRLIEESEGPIHLERLASSIGFSPHHFHRIFKTATGLTPKAYGDAHRIDLVRRQLEDKASVTDAIHRSGYGSSASFYASASRRLGMTPAAYRAGAPTESIWFAVAECSLGLILVASTSIGVCSVQFGDDADQLVAQLNNRFPRAQLLGNDPAFAAIVTRVVSLIERPSADASLPLDIRGTAFQERVWRALQQIPLGMTATYGAIAAAIGSPGAAQAVGRACAANDIAVIVPCHRVIRHDGSPSGYRWGLDRKQALLLRERVDVPSEG